MRGTRGHMPNEAGELLRYHAEKQLCSTSDRSPGSWVQKVGPSPRPLAFPNEFVEWRTSGSLPTYSGGTAPVFHRTSLLCPFGHPRGYAVTLCATYLISHYPVNLEYRHLSRMRAISLPLNGLPRYIDRRLADTAVRHGNHQSWIIPHAQLDGKIVFHAHTTKNRADRPAE